MVWMGAETCWVHVLKIPIKYNKEVLKGLQFNLRHLEGCLGLDTIVKM